jgi:hypothetical protein
MPNKGTTEVWDPFPQISPTRKGRLLLEPTKGSSMGVHYDPLVYHTLSNDQKSMVKAMRDTAKKEGAHADKKEKLKKRKAAALKATQDTDSDTEDDVATVTRNVARVEIVVPPKAKDKRKVVVDSASSSASSSSDGESSASTPPPTYPRKNKAGEEFGRSSYTTLRSAMVGIATKKAAKTETATKVMKQEALTEAKKAELKPKTLKKLVKTITDQDKVPRKPAADKKSKATKVKEPTKKVKGSK